MSRIPSGHRFTLSAVVVRQVAAEAERLKRDKQVAARRIPGSAYRLRKARLAERRFREFEKTVIPRSRRNGWRNFRQLPIPGDGRDLRFMVSHGYSLVILVENQAVRAIHFERAPRGLLLLFQGR